MVYCFWHTSTVPRLNFADVLQTTKVFMTFFWRHTYDIFHKNISLCTLYSMSWQDKLQYMMRFLTKFYTMSYCWQDIILWCIFDDILYYNITYYTMWYFDDIYGKFWTTLYSDIFGRHTILFVFLKKICTMTFVGHHTTVYYDSSWTAYYTVLYIHYSDDSVVWQQV